MTWFRYWPAPVAWGASAGALVAFAYLVAYSALALAGRELALDHVVASLLLQPLGWGVLVGVVVAVYRWLARRGPGRVPGKRSTQR